VRSALLLLTLGAFVAAGCEETREQPAKAAPSVKQPLRPETGSGRDLDWLGRLHRWEVRFDRQTVAATSTLQGVRQGIETQRNLRRALQKIASCERDLRRKVGNPDASRYRPGYEFVVKGCRSRASVARRMIEAIVRRQPLPARYIRTENARGDTFFEQARDELESALRANRTLPIIAKKSSRSRMDRRLSRAAAELIWREPTGLEVRCWSRQEWTFVEKEWAAYVARPDLLGFVHQAALYRTSLAPEACERLAELTYDRARPSHGRGLIEMSLAVGVLAHEAEHIGDDWKGEAATECNAMQQIRWLARILGASRSYANLLAETYWREIYPMNPSEYRTPACHDGGPLDQHPGSNIWP
jgi:hypothetical protein